MPSSDHAHPAIFTSDPATFSFGVGPTIIELGSTFHTGNMAPVDNVGLASLYLIVVDYGAGGSCGTKDVCVINELEEPKNDEGCSFQLAMYTREVFGSQFTHGTL